MRRVLAAVLFWLAAWLLLGCAHRYSRTDTAQRTEETRTTWQTDTSAAETKQSVETKRTVSKRVVEKFRPDGTLLERMTEQADEDRKVATEAASASRSTAEGGQFRSVAASSSSARQADTKAGWWSPWWLLLLVPLAAGAWALRRRWRSLIPGWPWS